jgi:hypothetical protein
MTGHDPEHDQAGTGVPRWVKGFGIAGIVLLLLIVIMLLSGHGPGDHMHGLGQIPATEQWVQTGVLISGWS